MADSRRLPRPDSALAEGAGIYQEGLRRGTEAERELNRWSLACILFSTSSILGSFEIHGMGARRSWELFTMHIQFDLILA